MRVGIGYDVHRLVKGRKLFLGGVEIPFTKGLAGHSDADVILHAIGDALLGASDSGDIGQHFPNNDPKYKNISSLELLEKIYYILQRKKVKINNIDVMLIAEAPKISSYVVAMKDKISKILKIKKEDISIKATTNEDMGFIGTGKGIASFAIVSVKDK